MKSVNHGQYCSGPRISSFFGKKREYFVIPGFSKNSEWKIPNPIFFGFSGWWLDFIFGIHWENFSNYNCFWYVHWLQLLELDSYSLALEPFKMLWDVNFFSQSRFSYWRAPYWNAVSIDPHINRLCTQVDSAYKPYSMNFYEIMKMIVYIIWSFLSLFWNDMSHFFIFFEILSSYLALSSPLIFFRRTSYPLQFILISAAITEFFKCTFYLKLKTQFVRNIDINQISHKHYASNKNSELTPPLDPIDTLVFYWQRLKA